MKFTWRWTLAIVHILLAIILMMVGKVQQQSHHTEMAAKGVAQEYDYVAPAYVCLFVIDGPPALVLLPFVRFEVGMKLAQQFGFVLVIGIFWYWIGSLVGSSSAGDKFGGARRWARVAGFLGSVLLFGVGTHGLVSGSPLMIIDLAEIAWALMLGAYFARRIRPGGFGPPNRVQDMGTGI